MAVETGSSVQIEFKHDFNGKTMERFLADLSAQMHRRATRDMITRAGSVLAAEIRRQIKQRPMAYSRARNPQERRKARTAGQTPLRNAIKQKPWTIRKKGIIGIVVGADYRIAPHAHLAERGHDISPHKRRLIPKQRPIYREGMRTVAHYFQREAEDRATGQVYNALAEGLRRFIQKQGRR